jgi:phosphate transport system substrate-binding protein
VCEVAGQGFKRGHTGVLVNVQGTTIKLLALDGISATVNAVREGRFSMRRPLNLVTRGAAAGVVRTVLDFMVSSEGQHVVAAQEFVPLR